MTATKLPTSPLPLLNDPELAAAVDRKLAPLSGKPLEKAQGAVRKVYASNIQGPFSVILAAYETAIDEAVGGG